MKASTCNFEQELMCVIMLQLHHQQGSSKEEAIPSSPATRPHPAQATRPHPAPATHHRTVPSPEEAFPHRPPSTCHHLTCITLREAMEVRATLASPTRPSAWASSGEFQIKFTPTLFSSFFWFDRNLSQGFKAPNAL